MKTKGKYILKDQGKIRKSFLNYIKATNEIEGFLSCFWTGQENKALDQITRKLKHIQEASYSRNDDDRIYVNRNEGKY